MGVTVSMSEEVRRLQIRHQQKYNRSNSLDTNKQNRMPKIKGSLLQASNNYDQIRASSYCKTLPNSSNSQQLHIITTNSLKDYECQKIEEVKFTQTKENKQIKIDSNVRIPFVSQQGLKVSQKGLENSRQTQGQKQKKLKRAKF